MTLFVSDIFKSIQGEGPKIGTPSLFLRLGICNLSCTWCDTPYTWKKGQTDYKNIQIDQVIKVLAQQKKSSTIKNLVITGGEPLLQQKNLIPLLKNPFLKDFQIEFETNGSIPLLKEFEQFIQKQNHSFIKKFGIPKFSFNISPKLKDSGNKPYKVSFYPNSILKFVYVSKKSENLIDKFLKKNHHKLKIFIMPEGTTVAAFEAKNKDILNYCLKKGFIYTPRLHIYLFGNKRAT